MVGWDNCCCGASAGRPCGIGLTYFWGWEVLWLGIGSLMMGCGGHRSVWLVRRTSTQCIKSPRAYKLISLDVVIILKNFSARILCIFSSSLSCIFRLSQFLFVVLRCTLIQQWQKPIAFVNFLNRMFKVS